MVDENITEYRNRPQQVDVWANIMRKVINFTYFFGEISIRALYLNSIQNTSIPDLIQLFPDIHISNNHKFWFQEDGSISQVFKQNQIGG